MGLDSQTCPFMWYFPGKVQIPFDVQFDETSSSTAAAVGGKQQKGPQEMKGNAGTPGRLTHTNQERVSLKGEEDPQNLIITESASRFCLHHSNIHQEAGWSSGFTEILLLLLLFYVKLFYARS